VSRARYAAAMTMLAAVGAAPVVASAQAVGKEPSITIGAAGAAPTRVQPGAAFSVPVVVDMSGARDLDLASLTTSVTWDHALVKLDSVRSGKPSFGTLVQNSAKAAEGLLLLSVFNGTGTTKTVPVATLYFTAAGPAGNGTLTFAPSVAGNEVGKSIITQIKPRHAALCIGTAPANCPAH
jgi:hypothetical protein